MKLRTRITAAALGLAALPLTTGTWHFVSPRGFESAVPHFLGSPAFWVRLSGVGELACALGLLVPQTRRAAGWASAALFVVVFPANIDMGPCLARRRQQDRGVRTVAPPDPVGVVGALHRPRQARLGQRTHDERRIEPHPMNRQLG
jgi:uncharacterized membrane protein